MLKKLLKYDLESMFKVLTVFYILALFFAILTRLFLNIDSSFIMNIIGKICSGATISMIASILINNLMRSWVRFKSNLYGDESYLTHTLPVGRRTLYLSKVLASAITLAISALVIALTLWIAYYSQESIQSLKNVLLPIADAYGSTIMKVLLSFLFIFFLELASALQSGYTGIIIGHKMNNAKMPFSILFGFITYMLSQVSALLMLFIAALFNKDIMNLFFTTEMINLDMIKTIINLAIIIYTTIFIIIYFINTSLFKKGVNVD